MENLPLKDRLHLVRLSKDMNKNGIAKMLRISPSYLTRLENGERSIPQYIIDLLELDRPSTLRWYHNLMHILKAFSKHYMTTKEIIEIKEILKRILGV